jgi:hypothetical protein
VHRVHEDLRRSSAGGLAMKLPARVTRVPTRPLLAFQLKAQKRTCAAQVVPGVEL